MNPIQRRRIITRSNERRAVGLIEAFDDKGYLTLSHATSTYTISPIAKPPDYHPLGWRLTSKHNGERTYSSKYEALSAMRGMIVTEMLQTAHNPTYFPPEDELPF